MQRVLRSGASYSAWDGTVYRVTDPNFDLARLVERSVDEERDECTDDEDNQYDLLEDEWFEDDGDNARNYGATATTSPTSSSASLTSGKRFHENKRSKNARRHKRKLAQEALDAADAEPEVRQATRRKHVAAAEPITRPIDLEALPVTQTGYTAMREPKQARTQHRVYRLSDMVGPNSLYKFDLYKWSGRKTVPFVSPQDQVFMVLAGRPDAPEGCTAGEDDWEPDMTSLADLIEETGPKLSLSACHRRHRRGAFPATAHGHAYGGGRTEPMNVAEKPCNAPLFRKLLAHRGMRRIAGFSTGVATGWGPRLVKFYRKYGKRVRSKYPHLKRNFRHGVWSALTINYGPRTITIPHRDYSNVPWGWCPITALGRFDPRRGGHLIIWELRLVIEFPAGSTIILPSSVLTHSNVAVAPDERRFSVTQYTAGGLIRWVDQGFQTKESYLGKLSKRARAQEAVKAATRYREGLALYSTLAELRALAARHNDGALSDLSDLTELEDSDDEHGVSDA